MEDYVGQSAQIYGVEEHRLIGGKGDGMRLFEVRNGKGLEFTVSADRCADISRLSFKGDNYGYFSPAGYVAPSYYDDKGAGFLKSFTGGFLTTCGLNAVGNPCMDEGVEYPLHGSIANCPAQWVNAFTADGWIRIQAVMNPGTSFGDKLVLKREIACSLTANQIVITDEIKNQGADPAPVLLLYHMNMGYPLLDEKSELYIPSVSVKGRDDYAQENISDWMQMEKPRAGFVEQCYYHSFKEAGLAAIFSPNINKGMAIRFDPKQLDSFVEWKMFGIKDYVLGLEPGNCYPEGRDVLRKREQLKFLDYQESVKYSVVLEALEADDFIKLKCSKQ